MKQTVNRKGVIAFIAETNGVSKVVAERMYNAVLKGLEEAICTGKCVSVGNMFRIQSAMRKGGKGVNPKTKEVLERKDKPRLKVTLSSLFAEKVEAAAKKA